jgi:hypothetical protein
MRNEPTPAERREWAAAQKRVAASLAARRKATTKAPYDPNAKYGDKR